MGSRRPRPRFTGDRSRPSFLFSVRANFREGAEEAREVPTEPGRGEGAGAGAWNGVAGDAVKPGQEPFPQRVRDGVRRVQAVRRHVHLVRRQAGEARLELLEEKQRRGRLLLGRLRQVGRRRVLVQVLAAREFVAAPVQRAYGGGSRGVGAAGGRASSARGRPQQGPDRHRPQQAPAGQ